MWLYLPSTLYRSAQAPDSLTEVSPTLPEQLGLNLERFATLSGKLRQRRVWRRAWKRRSWMRRLFTPICDHSTAPGGLDLWIASLAASRAPATALPDSADCIPTNATCGTQRSNYFGHFDADGSLWKTCEASLFQTAEENLKPGPEGLSETWPVNGGMRSGVCFRRAMLEPPCFDTAPSSWPGAAAADAKLARCYARGNPSLALHAKNWPTVMANDLRRTGPMGNGSDSLPSAVKMWPTITGTEGEKMPHARHDQDRTLTSESLRFPNWGTPRATDCKGAGQPGDKAHTHRMEKGYLDAQSVARPPTVSEWNSPAASLGSPGNRKGEKLLAGQALDFPDMPSANSPDSPPPPMTMQVGSAYCELIRLLCQLFECQTEAEFRATRKTLNPRFVELLMGWDPGWTSLADRLRLGGNGVVPDQAAYAFYHLWRRMMGGTNERD